MKKEIELIPGYDPDEFRNQLCEKGEKIRKTMSQQEYLIYINEKAKKLCPHREFICVGTELKTDKID